MGRRACQRVGPWLFGAAALLVALLVEADRRRVLFRVSFAARVQNSVEVCLMKMLVDFSFPLEPFNTMVKNGTAGAAIEKALGDIKPETVYFTERDGKRGGTMVVEVADGSSVPSIAEPLFLSFDASVSFHILMSPEDLARAGLEEMGKKYA